MSGKGKFEPVLKVELVEKYLNGEIGIREAARMAGLSGNRTDSFYQWVNIYENEVPSALLNQE